MAEDWFTFSPPLLEYERRGLVTRTFRRLDPERQRAVLDAILAEAAEKGPERVNVKAVATRAGVSVGSLYQYFGSRRRLLDFTIELVVRYMVEAFNAARPYLQSMPLRDALAGYLSEGLAWSQAQAGFIQFFARAAYHGDPELGERVVRPIADVMRQVILEMLSQAAGRGELRPDVDLDATARVVHALTIAVGDPLLLPYLNTYFQVSNESVPPTRLIDALLALVLHGIAARQPEPRAARKRSGTRRRSRR